MLTFKIKSFCLSMTFGFFFVLALTSLKSGDIGAWSLLFCILHEFGHLFTLRLLGIKITELRFYGGGIRISAYGLELLSKPMRAAVYISGPAVNLFLGVLLSGAGSYINLSLAVFNLLPASYLDGGKILSLFLPEKPSKIISAATVSMIMLILFLAALSNPAMLSASSLMTLGFMILATVLDR